MLHALCTLPDLIMIKGLFITGTDTGVGKTYVAVKLAKNLMLRGIDVGVMKPVETGCRRHGGKLVPSDAVKLIESIRTQDPLDLVNPYRFEKALAPSVAAEIERKRIRPAGLLRAFKTLSKRHEFMIVEGAGGILVPLTNQYSYLDLAEDLGLQVVIVARPGLGTINHTLLTVAVLKQWKITIAGIVISHAQHNRTGLTEKTNPGIIEKISGIKILGVVPYGSDIGKHISDKILSLQTKKKGSS